MSATQLAATGAMVPASMVREHQRKAVDRIIGRCDGRNAASAKAMERLGMRREAHLRENEMVKGEWCDELVYAMLVDEWRALGKSAAT